MGKSEFSVGSFEKWREREWALFRTPSLEYAGHSGKYLSPMAALKYAFSLLDTGQWVEADELKPILEIFCKDGSALDIHEVLRQGWEKACLVRQKANGKIMYRHAGAFPETQGDFPYGDSLHRGQKGSISVDLETIPIELLETVSRIALFQIEDGCLIASPDIIRMGRVFHESQKDPLTIWLAEKSEPFSKAFETVSERWGTCLIHRNLMIAKVKNIGLKVALEKSFKDGVIIFLPDDFIAFPVSVYDQVEDLVINNGFAVKTFESSSGKAESV